MIISMFGHATFLPNEDDEKRVISIIEKISNQSKVIFYLGGYGSFDSFALNCAQKYKNIYPQSKIYFITPYLGKWIDNRRKLYQGLYDEVIYPNLENVPPKFAIVKRNQWMIKNSDYVICYVSVGFGGAYQSMLYAQKQNKPYLNLFKVK